MDTDIRVKSEEQAMIKKVLPRIAIGGDHLFPVVVYRRGKDPTLDQPEESDVLVRPEEMIDLSIIICNSECGCMAKPTAVTVQGGQLLVEISGELTNVLGPGVYRLDVSYNEMNPHYDDGKRLIVLSRNLCHAVSPSEATRPMAEELRLVVQDMIQGDKGDPGLSAFDWAVREGLCSTITQYLDLIRGATGESAYQTYLRTTTDNPKKSETEWMASLTGKSAYQIYLDTTNDSPKMTEEEWASGGWLVVIELIKNVRGTR